MIGRTAQEIVDELLDKVAETKASDLHLSVGKPPILRINGKLYAVSEIPSIGRNDIQEISRIIAGEERGRLFEQNQEELDLPFEHKGGYRFRVNLYYSSREIAIAMRAIPSEIKNLKQLNLPSELEQFIHYSQGFVLITGPTGHGKTTTMAALVDMINKTRVAHIITIEDPIEYLYKEDKCLIHQREVGNDTPSFAQALKMAFREDPNVVVIGEMRDLESIATALMIAETGHLVFATLHTNDSSQTINRIVDVFPASQQAQIRMQLSVTLTGVVSQRLVSAKDGTLVPAIELLLATPAVRNLIREGEIAQIPGVMQTSSGSGMITMEQSLKELVNSGKVSQEEVQLFLHGAEI